LASCLAPCLEEASCFEEASCLEDKLLEEGNFLEPILDGDTPEPFSACIVSALRFSSCSIRCCSSRS